MESIKDKLNLIEEAIDDWKRGELTDIAAITAIGIIIDCREAPEETIRWAIKSLKENGEI